MPQVSRFDSFSSEVNKYQSRTFSRNFQKEENGNNFYSGYDISTTAYFQDTLSGSIENNVGDGLHERIKNMAVRLSGNSGYYRSSTSGSNDIFIEKSNKMKSFDFILKINSNHRRGTLVSNLGGATTLTNGTIVTRWGIYISLDGDLVFGDISTSVLFFDKIIIPKIKLDNLIGEWIHISVFFATNSNATDKGLLLITINNEVVIEELSTTSNTAIGNGTTNGGVIGGRNAVINSLPYSFDTETFGSFDSLRKSQFTTDMEILYLGETLIGISGSNHYPQNKYFPSVKYIDFINQNKIELFDRHSFINPLQGVLDYYPLDNNSNESSIKIESKLKLDSFIGSCDYLNIISGKLSFNIFKSNSFSVTSQLNASLTKNYTMFINPYQDGIILSIGSSKISISYTIANGFSIGGQVTIIPTSGQIRTEFNHWFQITLKLQTHSPWNSLELFIVSDSGVEYSITTTYTEDIFSTDLDFINISNINICHIIEHYGVARNILESQNLNHLLFDGDHEIYCLGQMPVCRNSESKEFNLIDIDSTTNDIFQGVLEFNGTTSYIDLSDSLPQDDSFTLLIDFIRLNGQPAKEILFSSDNFELYFNNNNKLTTRIFDNVTEEVIDYDFVQCNKYQILIVFKRFSGDSDKLFYINGELIHTSTNDNPTKSFIGDVYFGKKAPDAINSGTTFNGQLKRFEIKINRDYRDSIISSKYEIENDKYFKQLSKYGIPSKYISTNDTFGIRNLGHFDNSYNENSAIALVNNISIGSRITLFSIDSENIKLFVTEQLPKTFNYKDSDGSFSEITNRVTANVQNWDTVREIRYYQSGFEEQLFVHNFTTGVLGHVYNIDKNAIIYQPKQLISKDGIVTDISISGIICDQSSINVINYETDLTWRTYSTISFSEQQKFNPKNDEEFQAIYRKFPRWNISFSSKHVGSFDTWHAYQDASFGFISGAQDFTQSLTKIAIPGTLYQTPTTLPSQDFREPNKFQNSASKSDNRIVYNSRNTGTAGFKFKTSAMNVSSSISSGTIPVNGKNFAILTGFGTANYNTYLQISNSDRKKYSNHRNNQTSFTVQTLENFGFPEIINRTNISVGTISASKLSVWCLGYGDSTESYISSTNITDAGTIFTWGQQNSNDISAILPKDITETRRIFQYCQTQDRFTLGTSIQITIKYISGGEQVLYQAGKMNQDSSNWEHLIFIDSSDSINIKGSNTSVDSGVVLTDGETYQINVVFGDGNVQLYLNGEYAYKHDFLNSSTIRVVSNWVEEDFIPAYESIGGREFGATQTTISLIYNFVKWSFQTSPEFIFENYKKFNNSFKNVISGKITKTSCELGSGLIVNLIDTESGDIVQSQVTNSQGHYYFDGYFEEDLKYDVEF